ncbi:dienelactone hydrolase family protein [Bradyrhizobium sp.]|uniref:dienelactone hydrolase family protein n=1 Tax=Bradyrhizobium sp. TaxID=376 RepID=UPI000B06CA17|nr:dienelactone hydrolase family protein [Bradyrhizobium sp.]
MQSSPAVVVVLIAAMLGLPALVSGARAQFPPNETINVPSLTLTDEQFLNGDTANGIPVTLKGDLQFPSWDEHMPVVVLLHGSDGPRSSAASQWRGFLNRMGIATLRLDSFGGRGINQVQTDQSRLSVFAQIYDAYRAVEVLAARPRIDPSRIAVMGFSRGGSAALYTSMRRFQRLHGPRGARIAAHLPFYPSCNIQLVGELDIADAPVREFHGASDDWTLAGPCRDYIARLKAAGKDAAMTEYPGVSHAFDNPHARPGNPIRSAQTSRNCRRREQGGTVINVETGKPFTYSDVCVVFGPTVGYNKAATEAAQAAVKDFLTIVFRLN